MKKSNLDVEVFQFDLDDAEYKGYGYYLINERRLDSEEIVKEIFESEGWVVCKPNDDFDTFKMMLMGIRKKSNYLGELYDSIKDSNRTLPNGKLLPQLIGIPDFFMVRNWVLTEDGTYKNIPDWKFIEVKSQKGSIDYRQIKWALKWCVPKLTYVYVMV